MLSQVQVEQLTKSFQNILKRVQHLPKRDRVLNSEGKLEDGDLHTKTIRHLMGQLSDMVIGAHQEAILLHDGLEELPILEDVEVSLSDRQIIELVRKHPVYGSATSHRYNQYEDKDLLRMAHCVNDGFQNPTEAQWRAELDYFEQVWKKEEVRLQAKAQTK